MATTTLCLAALPCLLSNARATAAPPRTELVYEVRVADPATAVVEVEGLFSGLPATPEELTLALPERFAYVALDQPRLEGELEVRGPDGEALSVERSASFRWTVDRGDAEVIHLRLRVPLDHRAIPVVLERDAYEFPYLTEDHGFLVAGTLFPLPVLEEEDEGVAESLATVRFALPEGWAVRCPWPELEPGSFRPEDPACLHDDLIALGNWEERVIDAGGCEVTLAVAPGQRGLLESVAPMIERIVRAELALFGRVPREKYLFLFARPDPPVAPGERGLSLGGSPKRGSMTLFLRGLPEGVDPAPYLGHLIAHEFHHTWTARLETPDELRFLGEGFTDYYSFLLLAREGLETWEAFADTLGEKLAAYSSNPLAGELSLTEAGGPRFFRDRDAYSLVYDGGLLFAALLDRRIRAREEGRSLDELMRTFNNERREAAAEGEEVVRALRATLGEYLSPAEADELWELVARPERIDFAARLRATGAKAEEASVTGPTGLRANLDGTRIRDLDPSGMGGRVGLRAGDVLLVVNGVECASAEDVRRGWSAAEEGRYAVTLERDGERLELDVTPPPLSRWVVDPAPWREHTATGTD